MAGLRPRKAEENGLKGQVGPGFQTSRSEPPHTGWGGVGGAGDVRASADRVQHTPRWPPAALWGHCLSRTPAEQDRQEALALGPLWLLSCSVMSTSLRPHDCSTPGFPVLHHLLSLLKLMSIESVMPSNHLILCHPLFFLASILYSIKVFSNDLALCIRWPKYLSFSFSISPSSKYSGLISFWIDWWDLLAVQGTLKSLLQHHNWKASVLRHSAFSMVQLSHSYSC